jgi:hypothetical protein
VRRVLVAVFCSVAVWVAIGAAAPASLGGHTTADEPQYLLTAISLGEDRNLDISDERANRRYTPFHAAALPVQEKTQDDGSLVSPHDPLLPALLALPMLAGGWIAAKLFLAVLAGGLAALMVWTAVARFGVARRAAVISVLAFSAAAPLAMYGTQVYPELPGALAVAVAVAALTGPMRARGLLAAGAAVVALPWLSVKYAPVAAVLAAIAVVRCWRRDDRRAAAGLVVLLVAAGGIFAVAHQAWYGGFTPYAAGDHFVGGEATVMGVDPDYAGRAVRLVGLLVDRDFGLAAWQPAFLLVIPALVLLLRDRPRHWFVLVGPLLIGWLNATFVALTMHGWWWPGRQTVVVLPCAVLAVTWFAAPRPAVLRAVALLGVFGASVFAWLVAQAVFGDLTTVVTFEQISYPLVRGWQAILPDYRAQTTRDWVLHGAWLVAIATCVLATVRTQRSHGRRREGAADTTRPHFPVRRERFTVRLKETTCESVG